MKIILISVCLIASLFANKADKDDLLGGDGNTNIQLKNGDASGANTLTKVSLWCDINSTNIKQFPIVNTTTISASGANGRLILKDITYDGRTPSYAQITSSKLILVFDTNDTAKSGGSLSIGAGALRDGSTGGALNDAITVDTGEIDDKAYPVFSSYETLDSNSDGHIDKIKLTFSENITMNGDTNKSFSVSGYVIPSSSSVSSSKSIELTLTPKTTYDTDAQPNTTYTFKTDSNISDGSNNFTPTITNIIEKDTAKPRLVYVGAKSEDKGGDKIYLGFSEPIKPNLKDGRIKLDVNGSITSSNTLTNATFTYGNGDRNLTITLNEEIDGLFIEDFTKTPNIIMETNATDKNDNNFTDHNRSSSVIIKEGGAPKLISISRVGDENKLKLTFDEPMSNTIATAGNYIVGNTNAPTPTPGATPTNAVQSTDKTSVTLTISNFPEFSSSETRTITIEAKVAIQDLVGNAILKTTVNDYNKTHTIAKDNVAPLATSFKLNMNTGKLDITFDEKIAVSGFSATTIDINSSSIKKKTLTSRSTAIYSANDVNISLNGDLDMIKNLLKDTSNVNLTVRANSGIVDFASVSFKGDPVIELSSSGFTADSTAPKLISWDYDLDKKKFTLLFDEAMKVGTYNPTKLKINDDNGTGGTAMLAGKSSAKVIDSYPYRTIEINLLASQVNSILETSNIGEDINKTHLLILSDSGFTDSKGNDIANNSRDRAKTYKSSRNTVATLNVIPNKWNHISVEHNTTSNDILSTGKVSYIYGHDGSKFVEFPATLSSHKGYWIKTSNSSGTSFTVAANKNTKGSKDDDLARIRSKTDGKFHLIGIENTLSYEEIQSYTPSECKSMRVHHYVSDTNISKEGWDVNSSLSANDALWVLCIK